VEDKADREESADAVEVGLQGHDEASGQADCWRTAQSVPPELHHPHGHDRLPHESDKVSLSPLSYLHVSINETSWKNFL